ncbi:MAG TPA: TlpA disulfide reductase family protein [Parasegetibacter sp.]
MKRTIVLFAGLFVIASSYAQTSYHIKGTVPDGYPATHAVMSYPTDEKGGPYSSDTSAIDGGKFEFKGTIGRPQLAELNLIVPRPAGEGRRRNQSNEDNMKNVALFYLDGNINVSFDTAGKSTCTGGGAEELVWRDYQNMVIKRSKEPGAETGMEFFEKIIAEVVKKYPDNYVSVDLMDLFTQSTIQPGLVGPMYDALSQRMKNSEKVLGWVKRLEEARQLVTGTVDAPEFTINDVNGKPVSLSSFRGSYVLVDFWASWCVPCRAENPNVIAAYEKYKDKNFKVVGISLDTKKDAWLKAIEEDKLPWLQLCDFKASESEVSKAYKIRSIPANVLVDPNGKIVGKDLRGNDLHKLLGELLK